MPGITEIEGPARGVLSGGAKPARTTGPCQTESHMKLISTLVAAAFLFAASSTFAAEEAAAPAAPAAAPAAAAAPAPKAEKKEAKKAKKSAKKAAKAEKAPEAK